MAVKISILGFAGSLRQGSYNKVLLTGRPGCSAPRSGTGDL